MQLKLLGLSTTLHLRHIQKTVRILYIVKQISVHLINI